MQGLHIKNLSLNSKRQKHTDIKLIAVFALCGRAEVTITGSVSTRSMYVKLTVYTANRNTNTIPIS